MNKRIKKKKHVYPFTEYGVDIDAEWIEELPFVFENQKDADEHTVRFLKFLDKFEELGFVGGGGSNNKTIGFFTCSRKKYSAPQLASLQELKSWMESTGWFKNIIISEYVDSWHDRPLHDGDKRKLNKINAQIS